MVTWKLKDCPRCGGDSYIDEDIDPISGYKIPYQQCLLCSHRKDLEKIPRDLKEIPSESNVSQPNSSVLENKLNGTIQRSVPDNLIELLGYINPEEGYNTAQFIAHFMNVPERIVEKWLGVLVENNYAKKIDEKDGRKLKGIQYGRIPEGTKILNAYNQAFDEFKSSLKSYTDRSDVLSSEGRIMKEDGSLTSLGRFAVTRYEILHEFLEKTLQSETSEVEEEPEEVPAGIPTN